MASSPSSRRTALTIAWKSAPVGENEISPAHSRLGEVEDRVGQLGLLDQVGVVDQHRRAGGEAGPQAARRPVLLRDRSERLVVQRREEAGALHARHGRGVLGEEHVGRRCVALLQELGRQLGVAAVAQLDLDAGLLRERRRQLFEQLLVLGVVDDDLRPVVAAADRAERGDHRQGQGGNKTSHRTSG